MPDRRPDGLRLRITTSEQEPRGAGTFVQMGELRCACVDPLPTRLGFLAAKLGGELSHPPPERWMIPRHGHDNLAFMMRGVGLLDRNEELLAPVTITAEWWWWSREDDPSDDD